MLSCQRCAISNNLLIYGISRTCLRHNCATKKCSTAQRWRSTTKQSGVPEQCSGHLNLIQVVEGRLQAGMARSRSGWQLCCMCTIALFLHAASHNLEESNVSALIFPSNKPVVGCKPA